MWVSELKQTMKQSRIAKCVLAVFETTTITAYVVVLPSNHSLGQGVYVCLKRPKLDPVTRAESE